MFLHVHSNAFTLTVPTCAEQAPVAHISYTFLPAASVVFFSPSHFFHISVCPFVLPPLYISVVNLTSFPSHVVWLPW